MSARSPVRNLHVLLLLALAGGLAACGTARPTPPPQMAVSGDYRVGPPDQLTVTILPEPVIQRNVTVRPDGKISIDLIGDVQAAGRTTEEIAQEIEDRISRYKRNARATVAVGLAQSNTVVIFGEVRSPGTLRLERDTRVAEALGLVGGPTQFARKAKIHVVRTDGAKTRLFPVDLGAIWDGDLSTNILLAPGDIIVVPPNGFAVVGYALQMVFFPFQPFFGMAGSVGGVYGLAGGYGN